MITTTYACIQFSVYCVNVYTNYYNFNILVMEKKYMINFSMIWNLRYF